MVKAAVLTEKEVIEKQRKERKEKLESEVKRHGVEYVKNVGVES